MLEKPLTKRQLGLLATAGGIITLAGLFVYDLLGLGSAGGGFGPAQKLAVAAAIAIILFGLTLIPLGDKAA